MTNTRGKTTTYEYDEVNRLITVTDPLSRDTDYDYDDAGRRTSRLDGNGVTTTYTYDVVDRLTGINYGDTTPDVTFTYDALGNRITMADGTGTTEYDYEALYRRTSIEDGQNNVVGYDYDDAGHLVELTYPGGTDSVSYDYDDAGRLIEVTDRLANVTTYTYDDADRLTSTTLGNGLISDRTYDDGNRLTNLTNRDGGTPISSYAYTLDDVGNRTQMVDLSGTTSYAYDDLYRLTDVTYPNADVQTYDYDPMGNRTEKTHNTVPTAYSYDDADQMTLAGGVSYDYDDNGNQVAAGADTFEWDGENRLIETNISSIIGTYEYNGDGLRMTRTIGASAVSYVWDLSYGMPVVLEDNEGNRYTYGLDLLTRINGSDEEWHLYDGLGSTVRMADESATTTASYEYDALGGVRAHTGDETEWSYTGEQNDPTGLEYLRARYYDRQTGRFLSRDPLPLIHRYPYVGNNPILYTDPLGLLGCCGVDLPDPPDIPNPVDVIDEVVDKGRDVVETATDFAQRAFTPNCLSAALGVGAIAISIAFPTLSPVAAGLFLTYTGPVWVYGAWNNGRTLSNWDKEGGLTRGLAAAGLGLDAAAFHSSLAGFAFGALGYTTAAGLVPLAGAGLATGVSAIQCYRDVF